MVRLASTLYASLVPPANYIASYLFSYMVYMYIYSQAATSDQKDNQISVVEEVSNYIAMYICNYVYVFILQILHTCSVQQLPQKLVLKIMKERVFTIQFIL